MAVRYPAAQLRMLGDQTQPPMRRHDVICLHTMVGYLYSTDVMFKRNGFTGTESHFGVGGRWGSDVSSGRRLDGVVYQWQDLDFTADANLNGNPYVISIETADNAPDSAADIAAWTSAQCAAISKLVAWLCDRYDIPATLIPDSKPGRRGIAFHREGCEHSDGVGSHPGWLQVGGVRWSSSLGKGCPEVRRIAQIQNVIIPTVRRLLTPPPAPTPSTGDDMQPSDELSVMSYLEGLYPSAADGKMSLDELWQHSAGQSAAALRAVLQLRADIMPKLDALVDALDTSVAAPRELDAHAAGLDALVAGAFAAQPADAPAAAASAGRIVEPEGSAATDEDIARMRELDDGPEPEFAHVKGPDAGG